MGLEPTAAASYCLADLRVKRTSVCFYGTCIKDMAFVLHFGVLDMMLLLESTLFQDILHNGVWCDNSFYFATIS